MFNKDDDDDDEMQVIYEQCECSDNVLGLVVEFCGRYSIGVPFIVTVGGGDNQRYPLWVVQYITKVVNDADQSTFSGVMHAAADLGIDLLKELCCKLTATPIWLDQPSTIIAKLDNYLGIVDLLRILYPQTTESRDDDDDEDDSPSNKKLKPSNPVKSDKEKSDKEKDMELMACFSSKMEEKVAHAGDTAVMATIYIQQEDGKPLEVITVKTKCAGMRDWPLPRGGMHKILGTYGSPGNRYGWLVKDLPVTINCVDSTTTVIKDQQGRKVVKIKIDHQSEGESVDTYQTTWTPSFH